MNWFRRFMSGRYGVDQLYMALIAVSAVFLMLASITGLRVLTILSLLPFIYAYYRVLSRNRLRRSQENYRFLKLWAPIGGGIKRFFARLTGMRTYRYFKCTGCGQSLRVPRGKGKIRITCPKCRTVLIKKT